MSASHSPDAIHPASPHDARRPARKPPSRSASPPQPPAAGPWWRTRLFRGMVHDVRRRLPLYASDWRDAWDYRVVPATVYMYFANILPALAFSLDMFNKTGSNYGVNEVLLASVLGAVVFAVFACQPLVIVGVTGPITVFNYTVYDIIEPTGVNYIGFMCWIGLWSMVLHWILAIWNSCNWLRWVTRFPCDIFGFYVAFIYLQKGVEVLLRLGEDAEAGNQASFYLSIMAALLVFGVAYVVSEVGTASRLFGHRLRVFLKDYGTPLTLIFFTGFVYIGRMRNVDLEVLPTGIAFSPTDTLRSWLVDFWTLGVGDIFLALPFAVLLTVLFWFDHNVSSLMAQGTEFPLKKPAGFHWDLFLLGLTTGVAGILGLPFPNGLIPQAPFHTESLCVTKAVWDVPKAQKDPSTTTTPSPADTEDNTDSPPAVEALTYKLVRTHVVEQRVSNLAQGLLTLGTMTGPLLTVLHLIPHGVLAGLFFIMGIQALAANGITAKLSYLLRDRALTAAPGSLTDPAEQALRRLPRQRAVWAFVAVQLVGFAATFAITQTIAAVGFPIFIMLLIPVRAALLPRWFSAEELAVLDGPTASPFTMEGIGGAWGAAEVHHGHGEDGDRVADGGGLTADKSAAGDLEKGDPRQPQPYLRHTTAATGRSVDDKDEISKDR